MLLQIRERLAAAVQAFRQKTEGFAAVEFAMVVPIMIIMFIGTVEMSESYTLARRVVTISGSVADLVTQSDKVSDGDLDDIMRIADSLLAGYDPSRLEITIISVIADDRGNPKVDWSYDKSGGSPLAQDTPYMELPIGLLPPGGSVVVAKVKYTFRPPISQNIVGELDLQEDFHLQPRRSAKVEKI